MLAVMVVMTISAKAMSYEEAKDNALFLSDKMAYELELTDDQYEAVYEINLDYIMCLNSPDDLYGTCWDRRNDNLRDVLSAWQYDKYLDIEYFYRPVAWEADAWAFLVFTHYARDVFFFAAPKAFTVYVGAAPRPPHFYADRIPFKPAGPGHHHGPAPHGPGPGGPGPGGPGPGPGAPGHNPGAPGHHPEAPNAAPNHNPGTPDAAPNHNPATPNNGNRPAAPNNDNRPSAPNGGNRPAGGPGGSVGGHGGPGGGPGGGRPAGGGGRPGGGPGGRR